MQASEALQLSRGACWGSASRAPLVLKTKHGLKRLAFLKHDLVLWAER